jgi:hypothetical protein
MVSDLRTHACGIQNLPAFKATSKVMKRDDRVAQDERDRNRDAAYAPNPKP